MCVCVSGCTSDGVILMNAYNGISVRDVTVVNSCLDSRSNHYSRTNNSSTEQHTQSQFKQEKKGTCVGVCDVEDI